MRYLFAFVFPPLTLFILGKPFQGILNLILWCLSWVGLFIFVVPGIVMWFICAAWAVAACGFARQDRQVNRVVAAIEERSKAVPAEK